MNKEELYYEVASNEEKAQHERSRHFNGMATTIFASSGVIASIMAFTIHYWVHWSLWPAIGVLITFIAGAFCSIRTIWLREWVSQPKLSDLDANLTKCDNDKLLIWTARQIGNAIQQHEIVLSSKAKWLQWSYIFLTLQVILLAIVIISVRT